MIILITGQPGSGKSALCVDMIAHDKQFENRPLFVGGIPDLTIPHESVPPVAEWTELRAAPEDETLKLAYFTFPDSSLVVLDEAQRIFRPRSAGSKVPPEVSAFETHRHTGVDFILLTQHPGLLDSNIRKLVGKHIHISVTPFGRFRYEWTKCGDPESKSDREIAARTRFNLPKRAFSLYKSSEKHTKIKTRIPGYAWLFLACVLAIGGIAYYLYGRIFNRAQSPVIEKIEQGAAGGFSGASSVPPNSHVMTAAEYNEAHNPRIPGLFHTAPIYDGVTKPRQAPIPVGCVLKVKEKTCRCIDQQGNRYATTLAQCSSIVENGLFVSWLEDSREDGGLEGASKARSKKASLN